MEIKEVKEKLKRVWFFVLLVVVAAALLAIKLLMGGEVVTTPLSVVSLKPENGSEGVEFKQVFQVVFNQSVGKENFSVKTDPETEFKIELIEDKVLDVSPVLPLRPKTKYEAVLTSNNEEFLSWSFTTKASESDPTIFSEIDKFNQENYPLMSVVPHIDKTFEIYYLGPKSMKVILKGTDKDASKKEALKWIIDQGGDPSKTLISYEEK